MTRLIWAVFIFLCLISVCLAQYRDYLPSDVYAHSSQYNRTRYHVPEYIHKFTNFDYSKEEINTFITRLEAESDDSEITPQCLKDTTFFFNDLNKGEGYTLKGW